MTEISSVKTLNIEKNVRICDCLVSVKATIAAVECSVNKSIICNEGNWFCPVIAPSSGCGRGSVVRRTRIDERCDIEMYFSCAAG